MGRQPRQRPVSCHLCRVRKLRCSRQFPCSNCTSRGLVCQHEGAVAAAATAAAAPPPPPDQIDSSPKDAISVVELLSRLEKLESLVASQSKDEGARGLPPSTESSQSGFISRPVPLRLQRLTADALRLERSCSDPKLTSSTLSDPIVFRACPIRLACSQPSFILQHRAALTGQQIDAVKCIWLPLRDEMRILIQKYITDISYFHHVIHVPTLVSLVDDIYAKLERNGPVDTGVVLLLVSICASTTFAWSSRDDVRNLFCNAVEGNSQSTFWMKQALDVSDHTQRTAQASMESLQGMVILFFVFCNQESVSPRARNVIMSAISTAAELSLHRIDAPPNMSTPAIARMSEAKKELGRRIWWYLVMMDSVLAQFNHLQEGFYVFHQRQTWVNKPRNIKDEDLVEGRDIIERPLSEPTCVSYLIQRLRLTELFEAYFYPSSRATPAAEAGTTYQDVLETDKKLKMFIQELPDFLSLDHTSLSHLSPTDPRRSPLLAAQRYALNLLLYRQLCKIHLPYLAQGAIDPAYAYSREVCLRSARAVIDLDHEFLDEHLHFCLSRLRLAMILRSVFLASIALALNACINNDDSSGGAGEEAVMGAWVILQEVQGQSPPPTRLLELSIQLLRKYGIKHKNLEILQQQISHFTASVGGSLLLADRAAQGQAQTVGVREPDALLLEQPWQKMDMNVVDWDKIFWGSDAPFI